MRKSIPQISDEVVLTKLSELDGNIRLIPSQVAMILAVSPDTLKDWRNQGRNLKFLKCGGSIRYTVDDVRNYLDKTNIRFSSTFEQQKYEKDRVYLE